MLKAKLISPVTRQGIQKTRVAAYCRVSSNSADQFNSYAAQIHAYTKLIQRRQDWELVEIFADEGISGMSAEKRPEFMRMIQMCERRQIDLIVTKSVSRFARNVKEALEYVRKLKLLGISVQFEKDGINTLSLGDEMLLNTFTAIAQEESKAISQHQRNSIVKRMERGEYVDSNAPYGFRLVDKHLVVYEPEAKIVREIFQAYLDGWSTAEIARELTQRHIPTKYGKEIWRSHIIAYMLSNERYVGHSKYQKTYRDTTVPFKQFKNRGQEDMYYATDTHVPLLDAVTFDRVQRLLAQRQGQFKKCSVKTTYPLTSRIRCSECGSYYRRKVRSGRVTWVCARHEADASACPSFYYAEDRIYDGIITMVNKLHFGEEDILGQVVARLEAAENQLKRANQAAYQISQSIAELNAKLLMLEQLRSKGYLAAEVYQAQSRDIQKQMRQLQQERKDELDSRIQEMLSEVRKLQGFLCELEEPLEDFDENLFLEIVTEMHLNRNDELTVTMLGGLRFTEQI